MDRYEIEGNVSDKMTINGIEYYIWKVVNNGQLVAAMAGPGSAIMALAAVERMNGVSQKWNWHGWTERLQGFFVKKEQP